MTIMEPATVPFTTSTEAGETVVAIDLGSNSFHLIIAQLTDSGFRTLCCEAQTVQLGEGVSESLVLSEQAIRRGLDCLTEFQQLIEQQQVVRGLAVGTCALRMAHNREQFLEPAAALLPGCTIEVVSGQEEARLVYQGVARSLPESLARRLVIDIGGGSTEWIVGAGQQSLSLHSVEVGCVAYQRFFPDGRITEEAFAQAYQQALQQFQHALTMLDSDWQEIVGCSGMLCAIEGALVAQGLCPAGIGLAPLQQVRDQVLSVAHWRELRFPGLKPSHRNIFVPGLAIVMALFEALQIDHMATSSTALREGLLWELLQRRAES